MKHTQLHRETETEREIQRQKERYRYRKKDTESENNPWDDTTPFILIPHGAFYRKNEGWEKAKYGNYLEKGGIMCKVLSEKVVGGC